MQITNYFTDKEKEGIELIQNTFLDKIDKIYMRHNIIFNVRQFTCRTYIFDFTKCTKN